MDKVLYFSSEIKLGFATFWASFLSAWGLEKITDYQIDIALKITMCILGAVFTVFRIKLAIAQTNREKITAHEAKKESAFNDRVRKHAEDAIIQETKDREADKIKKSKQGKRNGNN